jgi:hypothetical protein
MLQATHETAPIQFAEDSGIRFAYRRFGRRGVQFCRALNLTQFDVLGFRSAA